MWTYNKVLQYPINIKCPNPKLAKNIISQYGGAYSIWYNLYCKSSVEAVLLNSILSINR